MANLESTAELHRASLQRAGERTDGTSDYDTIALEQINTLYRSLFAGSNEYLVDLGEPWEWAKAKDPGILTLVPPFETGSVSLTQDSVSGTFSDAPTGLGSLKGQFLKIEGRTTVYRVLTHVANATAFTLDQSYLEETVALGVFKVIKLDYDLTAGMERLIAPMVTHKRQFNEDDLGQIHGIDKISFEREFPIKRLQSGTPTRFAEIFEFEGLKTVRFNRFPATEKLRIEFSFIPIPEDLVIVDFLDAAVDTGTDIITAADHGMPEGHPVQFENSGGALPTGLSLNTTLFASTVTTNTFKVATTQNDPTTEIDITAAAGTGTHTVSSIPLVPRSFRKVLQYSGSNIVHIDKSDSRADLSFRQTQSTLQSLVTANRKIKKHISKNKARIIPRTDNAGFRERIHRPRVFS